MLLQLLKDAVEQEVQPHTGVLLSGGLDSSTVAMLAGPLTTFTGYYAEDGYSELGYARLVTAKTGARHVTVKITPLDFLHYFDEMKEIIKPPYQGVGTFGQYMVAKEAGKHVDRLLSGEGSDELFGGYARLQIVAGHNPPRGYEQYVLPDGYPRELTAALKYDLDRLPDLLAVDDQVCAAHGITAIAPFLDKRVVEYALGLDPQQRVGKTVLRDAARGLVPDEIIDRQDKMGFPAPFVKWAQGPLRNFIKNRIGYIPDPSKPYAREWWIDLLDAT